MPTSVARCRPLARIKPYGLESPLLVSELLQPASEASLLTDDHLAHYKSALTAFLDRRWGDAYEELHSVPPEDRGKDMLLSFILTHDHTPPPDWDGVIPMKSKR
jgi:adenylate cyclase